MKTFFLNVSYSTVKTLVISLAGTLLFSVPALGQSNVNLTNVTCPSAPPCFSGKVALQTGTSEQGCPTYSCEYDCNTYKTEIQTALSNASAKCSQASLGSFSSCLSKVKSCMEDSTAQGTDPGMMDQLLAFGGQMGSQLLGQNLNLGGATGSTGPVGSCPNMSARDYADQKDRLSRQIESKQKELSDLQKDIAEAQKDFNQQKQDLTNETNEAQKELNEELLRVNEEQRDANRQLTESQSQVAEQIRRFNSELLEKRAELTRTEAQFMQRLSNMTSKLGEANCMIEVQKLREELRKAGIFRPSGGGVGAFSQQNAQRKTLQERFDNCLRDFRTQHVNLQTEREAYLKQAQNAIANIQENLNEAERAQMQMNEQIQAQLKDLEKKKANAYENQVRRVQTAQQALTDAFQNMQEQQKAIAARTSAITAEINTLNQDINRLGPAPSPGATNGWGEAQSAILDYRSKVVAVPDECQSAAGISSSDIRRLNEIDGTRTRGSSGRQ